MDENYISPEDIEQLKIFESMVEVVRQLTQTSGWYIGVYTQEMTGLDEALFQLMLEGPNEGDKPAEASPPPNAIPHPNAFLFDKWMHGFVSGLQIPPRPQEKRLSFYEKMQALDEPNGKTFPWEFMSNRTW